MSRPSDPAVAAVFFALSDETRLGLVSRLGRQPASATSLALDEPVTRQAILKHLQVLEEAGLVGHERRGREVLYSLHPRRIQDAQAFLNRISAQWDRRIDRLRRIVEAPSARRT